MNKEQLASRLLATFLDELDEQLRVLNADLLVLEGSPSSADTLRSVFRVMHTLKGAARAAHVPAIEQACHALESVLAAARAGSVTLGRDAFALLFDAADALADAGKRLRSGQGLDGSPIASLAAALAGDKVTSGVVPQGLREARREAPAPGGSEPTGPEHPAERTETALRVESAKLDALFAGVGALTVTSARIVERTEELAALDSSVSQSVTEWRRSVRRLRRRLTLAGEPLALETIASVEQSLERIARQVGRIAIAAARDRAALETATRSVADRVGLLRMRPFADVCEALPRVARDVAEESGKEVRVQFAGTDVQADRGVLDGIREALLHLVRNAVDHGIEPPKLRALRGKPRQGTVSVSAALRGDRLVVTVSDDGGGIDTAGVRDALARAGRTAAAGDRALANALLAGGVSTRAEASAISGRGVGLDAARAAVARIGGHLEVSWREGTGTTFVLETPLTLARIRAVTARAGTQVFALPTVHVERLIRLPRAEVRTVEGRSVFGAPDAAAHAIVPLVTLARLLGPPLVDRPLPDPVCVMLLAAGGVRLGVVVDEVSDERELVVRALPGRRAASPHVSGAAVLPRGGVALLLDIGSLVSAAHAIGDTGPADAARAVSGRPTILVVDDSLTTRTLERSILEAAGYTVLTAVDGVDGWRVIEHEGCDLVVADVEMPGMSGLALCEAIRSSQRHRSLPVVLVTALESDEDRARGLAVGADAYVGKSGFDQRTLLDTIARLLDREDA